MFFLYRVLNRNLFFLFSFIGVVSTLLLSLETAVAATSPTYYAGGANRSLSPSVYNSVRVYGFSKQSVGQQVCDGIAIINASIGGILASGGSLQYNGDHQCLYNGNVFIFVGVSSVSNNLKDCTNGDTTGNPCHVASGAKFSVETDFSYGEHNFTRNYHSMNMINNGFGKGWHNRYFQKLFISGNSLIIVENSGRAEEWNKVDDVWTGDSDSDYIVLETASGLTLTDKRGSVNSYSLEGQLLSEAEAQGAITTYEYDTQDRLIEVEDNYQQKVVFTYSDDGKDHVTKVTDAQGNEYQYEYDAKDNLIMVVYPDTTPNDDADNPRRIYHYENTNYPNHLTGITDENGDRFATYAYDANGKAISTEHAQTSNAAGQERFELDYQGAN